MPSHHPTWPDRLSRLSLSARVGVLAAALLVCWLGAIGVALAGFFPSNGDLVDFLAAPFVAMLICLAVGVASFVVMEVFSAPGMSPEMSLVGAMVGMMIRMSAPLAATMVVYLQNGSLAQAGFVYYLLIFYMVMLSVEVGLTVARTPAVAASRKPVSSGDSSRSSEA